MRGPDPTTRRARSASSRPSSVTSSIDQYALWRAEIIAEFRLRGDERCAAASPEPGFPQILESILAAVEAEVGGWWIHLGGGLGGAASWIERRLGQRVSLMDSSYSSLRAARRLFADLPAACTSMDAIPIRDSSVSVAIANGVISTADDLDGFLDEAARILVNGGRLAVTDVWSPPSTTNELCGTALPSIEDFAELAARRGFDIDHVAVADTTVGWWSSAATQITEEIHRRHRHHREFSFWSDDSERLEHALDNDELIASGLVLILDTDGPSELDTSAPTALD